MADISGEFQGVDYLATWQHTAADGVVWVATITRGIRYLISPSGVIRPAPAADDQAANHVRHAVHGIIGNLDP